MALRGVTFRLRFILNMKLTAHFQKDQNTETAMLTEDATQDISSKNIKKHYGRNKKINPKRGAENLF